MTQHRACCCAKCWHHLDICTECPDGDPFVSLPCLRLPDAEVGEVYRLDGVCYEVVAINQAASIGTELDDPMLEGPIADCATCCAEPTGRCCVESYQCIPDLTEAECLALSGDWREGQDCGPPNPCPPPTVDCDECEQRVLAGDCNPDLLLLRVEIGPIAVPCCSPPNNVMTVDQVINETCPQGGFAPQSDPTQLNCPGAIFYGQAGWICADANTVAFYAARSISVAFGDWVIDLELFDTNPSPDEAVFFVYTNNNPCGVGGYQFKGKYGGLTECGDPGAPSVTVSYA